MATYDARPSQFTQLTLTSEWEYLFSAGGIPDGIDMTIGSAMNPSLDTGGRNAVNADGVVVIKGQLWRCDAPVSTPIPAASAQNRIDRLVLRLTRGATTSSTVVTPTVITGTPGSSPTKPPLTQTTTGIWDIPVSSWSSTSAGAITSLLDERLPSKDMWHDLRALSSGFIGTNAGEYPPQYRMNAQRRVELFGTVQTPPSGSYNGVVWATITNPNYWCNKQANMSVAWPAAGTTNGVRLYNDASGGLYFQNIPGSMNSTLMRFSVGYPADVSNLIQS